MSFADTISASGFKGKLMFDVMAWFGDSHVHRVSRYKSTDPTVIKNQLALIKQAGGKGIRVTWKGPDPAYAFSHQATLQLCAQCDEEGLLFCLLLDPSVASDPFWYTDPGFLSMTAADCYIAEKYICDFSTRIDFTKVVLPPGFSVLANQKGFGWANAYNGANFQTLSELQNTNKLPTMKWPFLSMGFCDAGFPLPAGVIPSSFTGARDYGHSVWNVTKAARAIDHEAGNFFLDCVQALSFCPSAPYVGMVWNDSDENTGIEHFMAAMSGVRLGS